MKSLRFLTLMFLFLVSGCSTTAPSQTNGLVEREEERPQAPDYLEVVTFEEFKLLVDLNLVSVGFDQSDTNKTHPYFQVLFRVDFVADQDNIEPVDRFDIMSIVDCTEALVVNMHTVAYFQNRPKYQVAAGTMYSPPHQPQSPASEMIRFTCSNIEKLRQRSSQNNVKE